VTTGVSQWFGRADPASGSYPRPNLGREADLDAVIQPCQSRAAYEPRFSRISVARLLAANFTAV
jgi:hypothetical protein